MSEEHRRLVVEHRGIQAILSAMQNRFTLHREIQIYGVRTIVNFADSPGIVVVNLSVLFCTV